MRLYALVLLGLSLVACGGSEEAATSSAVVSSTTTTTAPATTTTVVTTTTTAVSADEAAIRERYALYSSHLDGGLDPESAAYEVLLPERRREVVDRIRIWASEGSTARGKVTFHVLGVSIDGTTATLVACKWDQAELVGADGEVLIPGDPAPLVNTDSWVKEDGEWFHSGREVSEETCVLE